MNWAAAHTHTHSPCIFSTVKHDMTGSRDTHTHIHTKPCEFRGSVGQWCSELLSHLLCGHAGYQKETGFFSIGLGSEPCCLWPKKQGFCYTLPLIEKNHSAYRTNRRLNISGGIVWLRWTNHCICSQTSFVLVFLLFFYSLRKYTQRMDCEHLCSKCVTKNSSVNKRCKKKKKKGPNWKSYSWYMAAPGSAKHSRTSLVEKGTLIYL